MVDTLAAVVMISSTNGLEGFRIQKKSIKTLDIIDVLNDLNKNYNGKPLTIFLDNLRAHHSRLLCDYVKENGWELLFNAPYSSRFNCIENIFSRVKGYYKKGLVAESILSI